MFFRFDNMSMLLFVILLFLLLISSFKFKRLRLVTVGFCIAIGFLFIVQKNNIQQEKTEEKEIIEIGELYNYKDKYDMSNVSVSSNIDLNESESKMEVYTLNQYKEEDLLKLAEKIFKNLDTDLNKSKIDKFDNSMICYSNDKRYQINMDFDSETYSFIDYKGKTNYEQMDTETLDKKPVDDKGNPIGKENIVDLLKKFNIEVPQDTEVSNYQNNYILKVPREKGRDYLEEGYVECLYLGGDLININNNLKKYKLFDTKSIISEKEAFEKLKKGQFDTSKISNIKNIVVNNVELDYELDNNNFYQPIYKFNCTIDDKKGNIIIPALK